MNAEPLILTVAPNGAYKSTADHAALPITPDALAATARASLEEGAAMLHLHVRQSDSQHSLRADDYRAAQAAIRAAVGQSLVIQVTTEAAGRYAPPEQMAVVRALRPEAVSVGLRELDRPGGADLGTLAAFFGWLLEAGVMTQVILYDAADVARWNALRAQGVIPPGRWFLLFVLGRYRTGQTSEPADLLPFLQAWDGEHPWAVCAFGASEQRCALAAAALGGHVRVGFENNLRLADGALAPDNAALVRQVAQAVPLLGLRLATAGELRARFSAPRRPAGR